jgi:hypothetical protein
METVTVTKKTFDKIIDGGSEDEIWENICEYEHDIHPNLPRIQGLDHITITTDCIKVYDRGVDRSGVIFDNSFQIKIKQ